MPNSITIHYLNTAWSSVGPNGSDVARKALALNDQEMKNIVYCKIYASISYIYLITLEPSGDVGRTQIQGPSTGP